MSTGYNTNNEDIHFYVDNAPPHEISHVLRVLSLEHPLTSNEIAEVTINEYGFKMQKDHNYSPRRLYDLGLATQQRQGAKLIYKLTGNGAKLQAIQAMNPAFAMDLLHFLHYIGYSGKPQNRKYFWSYRQCCKTLWSTQQLVRSEILASEVLSKMKEEFPSLDWTARVGARFDSTAINRIYTWLRALDPPPFTKTNKDLQLRQSDRYELALLALTDTYRSRGYRYGDAVLMDESLVTQVAGVFFLDLKCCADLLRFSVNIVPFAKMSDTLGGAAINLLRPFSIDNL